MRSSSSRVERPKRGHQEHADEDDELFHLYILGGYRAYSITAWVNPDDEDGEPLVMVWGPFDTQKQAEKHFRRLSRLPHGRKAGDWDTVPDRLRERVEKYALYGVRRIELGN
jgi:hypothetical protein